MDEIEKKDEQKRAKPARMAKAMKARRKKREGTPAPVVKTSPAPQLGSEPKPTRNPSSWKPALLSLGIALLLIGIAFGFIWINFFPKSPFVAIPTLGGLSGGIYFLWRGQGFWSSKEGGESIVLPSGTAPVPKGRVNSLSIYPDAVKFENFAIPQGQPWKCRNDGKLYFVHIESSAFTTNKPDPDRAKWTLKPFILPDQKYYDPEVFATRVLELPAHQRIFTRRQKLLEQLAPGMAALGMVIMAFIILVTTGEGG